MDDHLHPAIDIPGGLWRGAIVRVHSIGMTLTVVSMAGGPYIEGRRGPWDLADLSLDLHAPDGMGLGLAGLAARVAGRLGWDRQLVSVLLPFAVWAPPRWADMAPDAVLREAATLLARLDRLAAAVWPEYRVEAGRVPVWERVHPGVWVLRAGGLPSAGFGPAIVPLTLADTLTVAPSIGSLTDPIEAAGAALEVTDAGR